MADVLEVLGGVPTGHVLQNIITTRVLPMLQKAEIRQIAQDVTRREIRQIGQEGAGDISDRVGSYRGYVR